jgi:hypothetical protein
MRQLIRNQHVDLQQVYRRCAPYILEGWKPDKLTHIGRCNRETIYQAIRKYGAPDVKAKVTALEGSDAA